MKNFLIGVALIGGLVGGWFARQAFIKEPATQVTPANEVISVPAVIDSTNKPLEIPIKKPKPKVEERDSLIIHYQDTTIFVYDTLHIPAGSKFAEDAIEVKAPAKVKTRFYFDNNLFSHSLEYYPVPPAPAPVDKTRNWTIGVMVNGGYPQYAGAGLYYHNLKRGYFVGATGGLKTWGATVGVDVMRGKVK